MGSPFPDGTSLGAIDIDRDELVRVSELYLGSPVSGRIGRKGIVYFVRVRGIVQNPAFNVTGHGKVAECLFHKKLCVIPPTIHPDTDLPYRWVGRPLLEVDYRELPLVEA
jgi:hypothetical protein